MMGLKAREVATRRTVSLEDLVPADDFYRHLDRVLDLAFVRDLVRDTYAPAGRPTRRPGGLLPDGVNRVPSFGGN